jgi:predicted dehydrogenase
MKKLHAAVAGTGFIGPVHVEALRRLGIEVTGILGITHEEGQQVAERINVDHVYTTFEEICADGDVDVVHICTPNYAHYSMAREALLAGKHVICEKPLATQAGEAHDLARLAQNQRLVGAVSFIQRYYPLVQEARARIQDGKIGDVHILRGEFSRDWFSQPSDWNWRMDPELGGGLRAVADLATHWLDLVTWISGLEITAVMADFATFIPIRYKPRGSIFTYGAHSGFNANSDPVQVVNEDYASLLFNFSGGARGALTVSEVTPGRKNHFWWEIAGSLAALSWEQETPNVLWIGYREYPNQVLVKDPALMHPDARGFAVYPGGHAEGYPDTFAQFFRDVYGYIAAGELSQAPKFPTFMDGWRNMHLLEKIQRSGGEKRWIEIKHEEL